MEVLESRYLLALRALYMVQIWRGAFHNTTAVSQGLATSA
jgi:hypothetical protein